MRPNNFRTLDQHKTELREPPNIREIIKFWKKTEMAIFRYFAKAIYCK